MARNESDREDLLHEATAFVERIELALCATGPASALAGVAGEPIVAGFRANGALSIFFGADLVYQFNSTGELRRAYCGGLLFKASHGRLISLSRESQTGRGGRRKDEVQLVSCELTDAEQGEFLRHMGDRLHDLRNSLEAGRYTMVNQVPADADVLGRVRTWLAEHDGFRIANSPQLMP